MLVPRVHRAVAERLWCCFLNLMAFGTRTNQDQAVRDSIPVGSRQKQSYPQATHSPQQEGLTAETHRYWAEPSHTTLMNAPTWT